jgi:hypothetical protein
LQAEHNRLRGLDVPQRPGWYLIVVLAAFLQDFGRCPAFVIAHIPRFS